MEEVFFINKEGKRLSAENVNSHIGLANIVLNGDESLRQEFEKSKKESLLQFLLDDKGFMSVSDMGFYKKVSFDKTQISEEQKRWLLYYHEEGYELEDLSIGKDIIEER